MNGIRWRVQAWAARVTLLAAGLVLPIVLVEAAYRIEQRFRLGRPLTESPNSRWDARLGWVGREHVLGEGHLRTLVIGDSFTEGFGVPSERLWFKALADARPGTELRAYGGLGYGTLQELLVLERYREKYTPDLIILQLCTNDLINNYFPLEIQSYLQRAPGPRPYLEDGEIAMRFPRRGGALLMPLVGNLRIANKLQVNWDRLAADLAKREALHSIERDIVERGLSLPELDRAAKVTRRILAKIVKASAPARTVFVISDDSEPGVSVLRAIVKRLEVPLVMPRRWRPFPPEAFHTDGTHYSAEGNELFGRTLREILEAKRIL